MNLKPYIRDIPNFPKDGVIFRDITPLLSDAEAFKNAILRMSEPFRSAGIQKVAAIESRGFFFGPSVAIELGCGFVPVRKQGKLPCEADREPYSLEYGETIIEVHKDAFKTGDRVLLIDDVLATGGTICAAARLIEKQNAILSGIAFLVELDFLKGRESIKRNCPVVSLINY